MCNHPTISNGRLLTGESVRYKSGEEATVTCEEGFELRSKNRREKIICREDGSWEPAEEQDEFPVCRGKEKGNSF